MGRLAIAAALLLSLTSHAAAQGDGDGGRSRRRGGAEKPPLPPPSEKELGVPVYPGARYDGAISGGMSQSDQKIWLYFSNDVPAKVVAFYEQKTGKKAESWEKDKYLIKLAGKSAIPDHGVTVETLEGNPLFVGRGKTVISVMRMKRGD